MFSDGHSTSMYNRMGVDVILMSAAGTVGGRCYSCSVPGTWIQETCWTCRSCVMRRSVLTFGTFLLRCDGLATVLTSTLLISVDVIVSSNSSISSTARNIDGVNSVPEGDRDKVRWTHGFLFGTTWR